MRRFRLWCGLALLATVLVVGCQTTSGGSDGDRPSLVVLLVVDQLESSLFQRYADLYTGGLRRLLDDGYGFANATHDHANTYTAPGHVTLATGVHPVRHGIVGNDWSELEDGEWRGVYAVEDLQSLVLGYPDREGRGPANIERAGLADWITAHDPAAKVVSVSGKDRSAVGMAAQAPGHVYWLERYAGEFVTSEHYRPALPEWVSDFNTGELVSLYSDTLWTSGLPEEVKSRSRPDTSSFEANRRDTAFPHRVSERGDPTDEAGVNNWRWTYTPFPDRAVVAFAMRAIREEELGTRGVVDYLGLSLSQVDLVGHSYGPGSREQLDNLLRLDRELGRFFSFLDDEVGVGRWVLAMSADHGVLEIPEELAATGVEAGRLGREERIELLAALEGAAFAGNGAEAAKAAVLELPFVSAAYTFEEIEASEPADSFAVLYRNSHSTTRIVHREGRSGIYARTTPNFLSFGAGRTTHGSPYLYDRHVPVIFLGRGVQSGTSVERVATVDVAPTLARLAGVPAPDDLDGRVLESVFAR